MSRLLIQINDNIKELYGGKYIKLNSLDKNLEDIKVSFPIEDTVIEIEGNTYSALVVQSPKVSNNYYHQLEISKLSNDLSIKSLFPNDKITLDSPNQMLINDSPFAIYLNYSLTTSKVIKYKSGDTIHIGDCLSLNFKTPNKVEITNYRSDIVKVMLPSLLGIEKEYKDFPIYTNSPNINYKIKDEVVELLGPPENERKISVKDVIKKVIPSLVTMILTIIIAYFKPRGPYIIISLTTTIMAILFAITSFISDSRENKIYNAKRKEIYENYIKEQRAKLVLLKREEETILNNTYLNIDGILAEVARNSSRLYERNLESENFLKINIGKINTEPTYTLKNPINKLQVDKEELELKVEAIYNDFKELKNVPKVVDLSSSNIGIIGSRDIINEQMQNIIMQLIFFHSYLDAKLIHVIDKKERKYYEKFVNTKHSQFGEEDIYSIVDSEEVRDILFSSIIQVFREREEAINDKKRTLGTNFVFIISNYELMANHPIMEFLSKDKSNYGFSILFLTQRHENLINNINTVIELKNRQQGEVVIEESVAKHQRFILNKCARDEDVSSSVMKIGQLQHIKGVKSSIPEQITFLEMYDVEKVEDLQINKRWNDNQTYKTIKALLGKKTKTEQVYLDLHEKAHGPHGLIAGTTGSGKSEVIQTYILSLAANYSPYQVGFLLIDYKGGGMANLFEKMPHLLGSITNLDGYQAMRAMASIKSELRRRQTLFSKHDVNHINGYHKLFESGRVSEPLPHLFLISDEFAELKSNEPEFMKELVSAARIGRSLGVHLILATQKPSGVVDDQIWSNSKFKLCLKVAEEADSRELLKTGDAAYITNPGRGYLKVGTNELYEQFQSGYSGATYTETKEEIKDNRVYLIDNYGKSHLINRDLSGTEKIDEDEVDELRAVLAEINRIYQSNKYTLIRKPWIAPLKDKIVMSQELKSHKSKPNMKVSIGLIDIPDQQAQQQLTVDFETDQSLLVLGGPSSGKTSTIMTTILSLALQNDATLLEYYLLDFGSSGLIQAKALNQTADYIKVDDLDKIEKFKKRIKREIKNRRSLLEQQMVSNVKSYNDIAAELLKAIVIVIDNYDVIKDEGIDPNFELVKLIKDGLSLGIYPIISVGRLGVLNMSLQGIMTNRIVHFIEDKTELNNAIGRSEYAAQDKPGRVQLKLDKPEVAQIYFQCQGTQSDEILMETSKLIKEINSKSTVKNQALPVMPEIVEYKPEYYQNNKIFIGLDYEDIKPQYLEYENILVYGTAGHGKSSIISNILSQVKKEIYILDDNDYTAQSKRMPGQIYESDRALELLQVLEKELNILISEFGEKRSLEPNYTFHEYRKVVQSKVIYINQAHSLTKLQIVEKAKFMQVINDLSKVGYVIIFELSNIMEINEITKLAKDVRQKIYVGDPIQQSIVKFSNGSPKTKIGEAYISLSDNKLVKISKGKNEHK